MGGDRGGDRFGDRSVVWLVDEVLLQPVEVANDSSGIDAVASTRDALCRYSRGAIFSGFSVGCAEKEWVERGMGVGGAGDIVLDSAHLLDRTIAGDVLGDRAVRGTCFGVVSLAFTLYRCEYDRARAYERGIENGRVISVLKRVSSLTNRWS